MKSVAGKNRELLNRAEELQKVANAAMGEYGYSSPEYLQARNAAVQASQEWQESMRASHLTYEEIERRFPRLVKCVAWVLIGSRSEAACCIRDYRDGYAFGGEAVSHSGLSPADRIRHAVQVRRFALKGL